MPFTVHVTPHIMRHIFLLFLHCFHICRHLERQKSRRFPFSADQFQNSLCLHLKISRDTWAEYGKDPDMGPIVQEARMIVEDYWNDQLANDCKGARFALEANMGWNERWSTKQEIVHNVGNSLEEFLKKQEEPDA